MTPELDLIIENRKRIYPSPCPFKHDAPGGFGECMHCYELFPGWGDLYMNHNHRRSNILSRNGEGPSLSCPCNVFGEEFVKKTVEELLCR